MMNVRMRKAGIVALVLLFSLPWPVSAFVPRAGETVTFSETIQDDLYIAGGTVTVTGAVDGDVSAAGGTVVLSGQVSGAVLAAGGNVEVGGRVGRSIRAAGGTVRVDSAAGTDAVLAGGTVTVAEAARIGRDLVVGAGNVRIGGAVGRDVYVGGGSVVIGGTIQGSVEVQADQLVVLPTARIAGRLRYAGDRAAEIQAGAQVSGGVERVPSMARPRARSVAPWRGRVSWVWRAGEWVWLLTLGLVGFALLPAVPRNVVGEIRARFGASLLAGFLVLVAAPVAILALLISVVGIPLAAAVTLLWLLTLYPGQLFAATWLGERVLGAIRRGATTSTSWALVAGITALVILYALPFVGWVFRLLAVLSGLGAIWLALWRATRNRRVPTPEAR